MNRPSLACPIVVVACLTIPTVPAQAEETLDTILAKCEQNAVKYDTISARIRMSSEMNTGSAVIQSEANGSYEHRRHADKLLYRVEVKNQIKTKTRTRTIENEQDVLTVCDGQFAFTLAEQKGQKPTAVKDLPKASQTLLADRPFFEALVAAFNVTIKPDEQIEGHDVWVLEATPKNPSATQAARSLHYIRKDSAIRVRSSGHDATGRRTQLTSLSDVKLNPPLDAERFLFEAPEGVQVVDMVGTK